MMKWLTALAESAASVAETAAAEVLATPETAAVVDNALVNLPLFTKGLLTTLMGLLGVFLVLTLFFVTIKLMQKIGPRESK